jgi:DNA polymerase elongation subunit (family B)
VDPSVLIAAKRRAIGYLGFKNARFGKIDAHIATCAFSRGALKKATAIAESRGFRLVHGIVDSMWLKKKDATIDEYKLLCDDIERELDLPISFEGRYKWIVFLNSRVNPKLPVLNRYYGVFEDGSLKVRGIDLRRHDTANIVRNCQRAMLSVLAEANSSSEFIALIPKALKVMRMYVTMLRMRETPIEDLVLEKRLSKSPGEYTNRVEQGIAASHLVKEGGSVHGGQNVSYVITSDTSRISDNRAIPIELLDERAHYDSEKYITLLLSSAMNLLLPFGYNLDYLRRCAT